jgi:hypothetical protein
MIPLISIGPNMDSVLDHLRLPDLSLSFINFSPWYAVACGRLNYGLQNMAASILNRQLPFQTLSKLILV